VEQGDLNDTMKPSLSLSKTLIWYFLDRYSTYLSVILHPKRPKVSLLCI